jgi:hypothetical protein
MTEVWAAEPDLANPVALCFDDQGRAFVAESGRRRTSVPNISAFISVYLRFNSRLRSASGRGPIWSNGMGCKPSLHAGESLANRKPVTAAAT